MIDHNLKTLLIGDSAIMQTLRARILKVAPSPLSVLIQGPTGVGKELVAQAIHRASGRSGRFVPLNVSSIPEPMLFADAMFGHCRGAFTNAVGTTSGFIAEAERGTLFLDEIGTLALASQTALIRVLETQTYRQLGGTVDRHSDFRVVAATNTSLSYMAHRGHFRGDLMYRLQGTIITVPMLRERQEDIPHLADHFASHTHIGRGPMQFTKAAIHLLQQYDWPGNVRQLKHVIEMAMYSTETTLLDEGVIHAALSDYEEGVPANNGRVNYEELQELLEQYDGDVKGIATHYGKTVGTIYRWLREHRIPTWTRQRRRGQVEDRQYLNTTYSTALRG